MKILMINGSPHPRGCTYMALHEMEQVLQAAGAETQILTVGAEQVGGCTACGGCNATGRCVRGGLVNDAIDAMETADALVLASPVHYAGISGAMSAFVTGCSMPAAVGRISRAPASSRRAARARRPRSISWSNTR